jgi:undecaprenyl-diphosphatase
MADTAPGRFDLLRRRLLEEGAAVAAFLVAVLCALAFFEIADETAEAEGQALDVSILQALRPGTSPSDPIGPWWVEHAAADLTALGGISVLALVTLSVVGLLCLRARWGRALLLIGALGGGVVLSEALKGVFERTRPPDIYRTFETLNASFPSGHALQAAVVYLTLGTLAAQAMRTRAGKIYALSVAASIAVIVGLTRVYLGAHWMSDVLAGWCVGAAWAMACWLLGWALERRGLLKP